MGRSQNYRAACCHSNVGELTCQSIASARIDLKKTETISIIAYKIANSCVHQIEKVICFCVVCVSVGHVWIGCMVFV